jgi:hypothetical protein
MKLKVRSKRAWCFGQWQARDYEGTDVILKSVRSNRYAGLLVNSPSDALFQVAVCIEDAVLLVDR